MEKEEQVITPEVIEAARMSPNGWVYKIEGAFASDEHVPPEAIVGAWKVDGQGNLTGDFMNNPKYVPGVSGARST